MPLSRDAVRRHRFALAFIALVAGVVFLPALLRGDVFTLRDHFDYFQPLRWFTAQELRAGHLPLWNPYNASGEPWLANPQTGVFYPPAWVFVVLPFATAYMLFLLAHLLLLGWGAYALFVRRASSGAALAGAVALMFCGPVLSLLDVSNNLATLAWVPLVIWCAAEDAPILGGVTLALAFLGGEPFFAGVAALAFVAVSRKWRDIALAAAIALGLSAVQLFPFVELLRGSDRAARLDASVILRDSMPLRDWLRVAVPPTLDANAYDPRLAQHFIPVVYCGIVVVALAMAGIIVSLRKRSRDLVWLLLLGAAAIVASGPAFIAAMPLTLFRYPARLVPFGALAIVAMMVAGWERIRPGKRWADLLLVLCVAADLLWHARPLLQTGEFRTHAVPYAAGIGRDAKILRVGKPDPVRRAEWMAGYLNLYEKRFDAYTAAPVISERYATAYRRLVERSTPDELSMFSVGYVLTELALPHPLEPIARNRGITLYANTYSWPMAALVDARNVQGVMLELGTRSARAVVDTPHPSTVVLTQQDAPGWRLYVDGKREESFNVGGIFRAANVPAGHHEVLWTYLPASFVTGACVTFLTLVTMQVARFVKQRRHV